jgi:hypothetical protein
VQGQRLRGGVDGIADFNALQHQHDEEVHFYASTS